MDNVNYSGVHFSLAPSGALVYSSSILKTERTIPMACKRSLPSPLLWARLRAITLMVMAVAWLAAPTPRAGAAIMNFDPSGTVGINTADPAERLHVHGGAVRIQQNNMTGGNGHLLLGSSYPSPMSAGILSVSESPDYGLRIISEPLSGTGFGQYGSAVEIRTRQAYPGGLLNEGYIFSVNNAMSTKFAIAHNGQILLGNTPIGNYSNAHLKDQSGAALSAGGVWVSNSRRATKRNISLVDPAAAWALLDAMTPVDFEYKKQETRWRLADGSVVTSLEALTTTTVDAATGRASAARPLTEAEIEALRPEAETVWIDEGSGEWHRGFIVEDLPAALRQGDGVAALNIAAHNTAALQEAKRLVGAQQDRIASLEAENETLRALLADLQIAQSDSSRQVAHAIDGVDRRVDAVETGLEVLRADIDGDWIEIPFVEAWEEAPLTRPVASEKTVTRYHIDWQTMAIAPYQTVETVVDHVPTGETARRLKDGVVFDEASGRFFLTPLSALSTGDAAR